MITDRRKMTAVVTTHDKVIVEEAMWLLQQGRPTSTAVQRWVCEACGMIHTGSTVEACDSCGRTTALVRQPDFHIEMRSLY
jgi:rubrerythrin